MDGIARVSPDRVSMPAKAPSPTGTLRFTLPEYTLIWVSNYLTGTVALAHPCAPRHSNILSIVALLLYPPCIHVYLGF
jgi:hypothetical protein